MTWPGTAIYIAGILTGIVSTILGIMVFESMRMIQESLTGLQHNIDSVHNAQTALRNVVNGNAEDTMAKLDSIETAIKTLPAKAEIPEVIIDASQQTLDSRSV